MSQVRYDPGVRRLATLVLGLAASAWACGPPSPPPGAPRAASLRETGTGAAVDPTVHHARIVPESAEAWPRFGVEPGGGVRVLASGQRAILLSNGAVQAADDRLPATVNRFVPLPDRLGGGFLFVLGNSVYRADSWLAQPRPIYTHHSAIANLFAGLDRVYLRGTSGAHQALDPRTGDRLDPGPWPGGPAIGAYGAADGWRAVAITDFRGLVLTTDAGASWRPLPVPIDPKRVVVVGDDIAVSGVEATRREAWFEVRPDGQVARLARDPTTQGDRQSAPVFTPDPVFGKRPLVAAIEDGWPLTDGTALVARDGALARVRTSDGALLEVAKDAYPLKPSTCHAFSLTRKGADGAFGFACGEPRGASVIYAYDPYKGALREIRRWSTPRVVVSSGNGQVLSVGACDDAGTRPSDKEHLYCILGPDSAWREIRVRGALGGERVVALADGKVAILSPPMGDLSSARLTVLERGAATTRQVTFPVLSHEVARVMHLGVWLEGFEERRPGTLGGWVEASGTMVGLEIGLDGKAEIGQFIRDAGAPIVSGRYGLGWTSSRRGYETVNGGMTWTPFEAPEGIADHVTSRACGPIGCVAQGWLRVGWGERAKPADLPQVPPIRPMVAGSLRPIDLSCEPQSGPAPEAKKATPPPVVRPPPRPPSLGILGASHLGRIAPPPAPLLDLPPFIASVGPPVRDGERGVTFEITTTLEQARVGSSARIYATGPRSGDWDASNARWIVRWLAPYGGWPDVRSSAPVPPPAFILDAARMQSGQFSSFGGFTSYQISMGDEPAHALLIAKRSNPRVTLVYVLESDRPPLEVRRADGEPFVDIDAAIHEGGHWYFATPPGSQAELPHTILWQVEGTQARERARFPRATSESRGAVRLARRSDGRAIGIVVDGQPPPDRTGSARWVIPVDIESGRALEPEPLGLADLTDRGLVGPCAGTEDGWSLDAPLGLTVRLHTGDAPAGHLATTMARVRVSADRACLERLSGSLDGQNAAQQVAALASAKRPRKPGARTTVSVSVARVRYALACEERR